MPISSFCHGKTTNALEKVVEYYFKKEDYQNEVEKIKQSHLEITKGLLPKTIKFLEVAFFLMI